MTCRPGHAPKHPDFALGNREGRRHGGYSEREVGPLAEQVEAELPARAPWTARDGFAPARRRYARAEAIATLLWAHVAEHGPVDDDGNVLPALDALYRWESAAANRAAALGLDPSSLAKLVASLAAVPGDGTELEALRREGRALVEARSAALEAGGDA